MDQVHVSFDTRCSWRADRSGRSPGSWGWHGSRFVSTGRRRRRFGDRRLALGPGRSGTRWPSGLSAIVVEVRFRFGSQMPARPNEFQCRNRARRPRRCTRCVSMLRGTAWRSLADFEGHSA
jgi:hypothetical protein